MTGKMWIFKTWLEENIVKNSKSQEFRFLRALKKNLYMTENYSMGIFESPASQNIQHGKLAFGVFPSDNFHISYLKIFFKKIRWTMSQTGVGVCLGFLRGGGVVLQDF